MKKFPITFAGLVFAGVGWWLVSKGNVNGYILIFIAFLCVGAILGDKP